MAEAAINNTATATLNASIERGTLLKCLSRLQSIVEKRNTIPILSNIKIESKDGGLQLTATDMDLVATETIEATISQSGAVTVPAQTFYDIVRKLPDGAQISLSVDDATTQLVIESGNSRFALSFLPANDFPIMSEGALSHTFTLESKECLRLIDKCRFAMSNEETRYYLNGVFLHTSSEGDKLKAVATDGHRLARIEVALPAGASGMPSVIIPRKTVNELRKLLEEQGDEVEVGLSDSKIRFASGNLVLLSKLVDGTFPDYARVIPESNEALMEVDSKLFTQAVDRVSTISAEKTRGVKFGLSQGKIVLTSQSPEAGIATEEVEVTYSAEAFEIGFNSRYVLDMMGQLEGETAQFLFSDANAPALVSDPGDVSALYVIMPMRV